MLVGYAYAAVEDEDGLARQVEALRAAGCEQCRWDAGSWRDRPELERVLSTLHDGRDCLVVCRLDRLACSLRELIVTIAELSDRGVGLRSLDDGIDTRAATDRSVADWFGALARFDRVLVRERTRSDVSAERVPGRQGGLRRRDRSLRRMSTLEFAPDLIEPIIGFRHWRLLDGTLTSMFSTMPWPAPEMTARCTAGDHDPARTPSPGCTCGIYAYYDPCPRTASAMTADLVGGAVLMWGQVQAHATGMRAEHARIVALDLPLTRGPKRRAVTRVAEHLGVPAIGHRRLRPLALAHGAPLPASLRPPRQRAAVDRGTRLSEHDE